MLVTVLTDWTLDGTPHVTPTSQVDPLRTSLHTATVLRVLHTNLKGPGHTRCLTSRAFPLGWLCLPMLRLAEENPAVTPCGISCCHPPWLCFFSLLSIFAGNAASTNRAFVPRSR